ncbi:MAG: xanthine/uracil/vitamin C permease [Desulfobacterales bacterium]|nr:xanthine/uracil/vitamin C permease [Desulfobacterales bacterium]MDD4072574.1 xanthine/uracil/vitamin C permease [Desulfobacterales bacterium]MDD4393864.1 xanthine/uracil/vitamin C permease [Desulfobacterales bacterium]
MAIMFPTAKRKHGEEQPYIPMGPFKFRLPFIHFGVEMAEVYQALVMFVTALGAIALLQDMFGISFELALTIVAFHELMYCVQNIFGDPLVPGWITPAIPLTTAFLLKYGVGEDRIQALIALQMLVGIIYLILGLTGLAKKMINHIPRAMQSGIILGAGIAAITGKYCFQPGGAGLTKYPFSITAGGLLALYLLFSKGFTDRVKKEGSDSKSIFIKIANYGIVPGIILAILVGWISGEVTLPKFESGIIFIPRFKECIQQMSIFGVGIPPMSTWINAIPMALVAYIIAFGDMILGQTVVNEANKIRTDEEIDPDANRLSLLCGVRNVLEGSLAPTVTLAGPLWAAMTVAISERYKLGRKAMDSIIGGMASFDIMKFLSCLILPLICIFKPALPVALSLTLMIQGFACVYIAMGLVKNNTERGVAGITGGALAIAGPTVGLVVGLVLSFFLLGKDSFMKEKPEDSTPAEKKALEESQATT